MLTSHRTIKWIESLADQETMVQSGQRTSVDILTAKDEVLSVETAAFLREVFSHFEYLVRLFNDRVGDPSLRLVLTRGGEAESFALTRHEWKLAVTRAQPGVVKLQCDKRWTDDDPRGTKTSIMFGGSIEAQFGAFHDVEWSFLGSRVTCEQVARHYLTEFIQVSRQSARS